MSAPINASMNAPMNAPPHTGAEIVRLEGVSKSYDGAAALHPLDLSVSQGQFVTLLGPSGCGKSTTLRILGGFERPSAGRVILEGEDVTALPPNRRRVNMVFQDYALFPHMSVRRNIAFGLELKGMRQAAIRARCDLLMGFLELETLADRAPDQLSGGQRQRVALARALAPDPALLLLDEPLGALDARLRAQVQAELKAIQRRTSKTFVFVTHDQDEAMTMSDRIVVMNRGRIEQDGTPEELYFRPASRFVAEFLGETNMLEGVVAGREGEAVALDCQGARFSGLCAGAAPEHGARAAMSVRLESVGLSAEEPSAPNRLAMRVAGRVFRGSRIELALAPAGGAGPQIRAYLGSSSSPPPEGAVLWAAWSAQSASVLPI